MTITQTKAPEFVFISYRAARTTARKYGVHRISKTAVQYLNVFLDEMIYTMVKASSDHRLDHGKLSIIMHRLCPHGSLAVNAIADGENFLSRVSLRSDPREFPRGQLPLTTVVECMRAQCSIYSTMGSSCIFQPKGRALITSRTAAILCGVLEHVATFLIVDSILLARNHEQLFVDSRMFKTAIEANREIRGVYNKTDLASTMENRRAERFGPKRASECASKLDSPVVDCHSDFECDDDEMDVHTESPRRRDRGTLAKILGGFRSNRPKGLSISSNFSSPRSSIEDFLFNGRPSPKAMFSRSPESRNSTLGFPTIEQTREKICGPVPVNKEKAKNFEALINSTETLKISLTSSRLQTIEVKTTNRPKLVPRD
ncbi:hypothetical protein K493DRAFT_410562 [Basidiobolus meristosporus CBS 931.73]|uniref:Uncharacterized protein n=1 Tax=Basidiobolus meristosporus CBS 931.73 TaxID=1314790 RepID=A0A1Y1XTZ7_9FUNG|nr:hypothetical protein K493DRAFT_410562 [Basidiobolus meristosporus CBS 931.73]|eukprot:ORX89229.1 hypothetical protein K493DRAFT_410562 [Basidiobolus meristosporus CBS 931.73]